MEPFRWIGWYVVYDMSVCYIWWPSNDKWSDDQMKWDSLFHSLTAADPLQTNL